MKIQRLYGTRRNLSRVLMFTAAVFTLAIQASAAPAGGGLPWEAPMTAIATSLTGPVAYAIGLIGIAIAGGTMLVGRRSRRGRTQSMHDRSGHRSSRLRRAHAEFCIRRRRGVGLEEAT